MSSLSETSIAMPDSLVRYWTMWNEPALDSIRGHVDLAVTEDVVWADPRHHFTGRNALEANVRALRSEKPQYRFVIASEIDGHNSRLRYEWHMMRKHRVLLRGLDIVTMNSAGMIERVDGFFGPPLPLKAAESGVPPSLRFNRDLGQAG